MGRVVEGRGWERGDGSVVQKEEPYLDWKDIWMVEMKEGIEAVGWLAQKQAEQVT